MTVTQLKHQNLLFLSPALKKKRNNEPQWQGSLTFPGERKWKSRQLKYLMVVFPSYLIIRLQQFMVTALSRSLKNISFLLILVTWVTLNFFFWILIWRKFLCSPNTSCYLKKMHYFCAFFRDKSLTKEVTKLNDFKHMYNTGIILWWTIWVLNHLRMSKVQYNIL